MTTELYSYHSIFIAIEQFTIVWSQHLSYLKRERYQLYQYIQFFLRKLKENYKWIKIEILEKINFLIVDPQLIFVKFKRSLTFKFIYRDYKKKHFTLGTSRIWATSRYQRYASWCISRHWTFHLKKNPSH